jgi:hypothetical protein
MTIDTLHWLFSTIAQTYGAILGVFIMLTIYRLQTLSNDTENCRKRAERSALATLGTESYGLSPEGLAEKWKEHPDKQEATFDGQVMKNEMGRIKAYHLWSKKIRKWLIGFTLVYGAIIFAALLGIWFTGEVAMLSPIIVYRVFVGSLIISVISIILLIWYLVFDESPIRKARAVFHRK